MRITASPGTIGDWDGQEEAAAELWNDHIAPALDKLRDDQEDDDPSISLGNGIGADAGHWAWSEFCGRLGKVRDLESTKAEKIVKDLGKELIKRG